jgi:hypothetical protein
LDERRGANHLALIRSFLIDSGCSRALSEAFGANYFWTAFALPKIAGDAKYSAQLREKVLCAALAAIYHRCKKPLFHRAFCNARDFDSRQRCARIQNIIVLIRNVVARLLHVKRSSDTHTVKWSQCFFHCSVVNRMQCMSIPDRTDATPAMLHG